MLGQRVGPFHICFTVYAWRDEADVNGLCGGFPADWISSAPYSYVGGSATWRIDKWYAIWYTMLKFRKDHYAYDDGYGSPKESVWPC